MPSKFEMLIPVRNPTDVFSRTVASLVAQTNRDFSVLISDNFSTKGGEHIEHAVETLQAAGIPVRKIQPPVELGRVEHWNWLHYQSGADWLKPLFAGDWLEPAYFVRVREIAATGRSRYVVMSYILRRPGERDEVVTNPWAGAFRSPTEMQQVVLRCGMQFGPPSVAAYERTAFFALGGFPAALPIVADSLFFCTLAARFGVTAVAEPLCGFHIHTARFSTSLPGKRRDTFSETITYFSLLGYHAWTERERFPVGYLRLFGRTIWAYLKGGR